MYDERRYRKPYRNAIGGIAAGIFIICLAVAIFLGGVSGHWFLPILFVGLAFASLIGSFSSYDHRAAYGGLQGFVWLLGLALCFWIGFWPWILLPVGFSIILGALAAPIMGSMRSSVFPPTTQQYPPPYPYQPGQPLPPNQQSQPGEPPLERAPAASQEGEPQHQPV